MSDNKDPENQIQKEKFSEADAGDGTKVYEQFLTGVPFFMCFIACFISLFLIGLDQTIVMTILVTVGEKFNAYDKVSWLSTGYLLTMCIFAATWGRVSITFGRKYSFITAVVLFEAGSLMCALSQNINVLIGGRVLAGIGGGGVQTLAFVVASEITTIDKRSLVFSIFGVALSVSSVCGPLIGGAFTENVSWRWCFYINLPLGGLAVLALFFFLKPPPAKGTLKEKLKKLDYVGTFLFMVAIVLLLLALSFGGVQFPWKSGVVISFFVLSFLFCIAFGLWNFKLSHAPIIPYELVITLGVLLPVSALFLVFFCFMGSVLYLTTYFQIVNNANPLSTGVHLLPLILGITVSSLGSGFLMRGTRYIKPFAIVGSIFGACGLGSITLLNQYSSRGEKIGLLILPGLAIGCLLQTGMMSAQISAPKKTGATILTTSFFNFSRALGGSIGSDLAQTIFNSSYKSAVKKGASKLSGVLTEAEIISIASKPDQLHALDDETRDIIVTWIMHSIRNVFISSTSLMCLCVVLCCLFSNKRLPSATEVKTKEDYEAELKEQNSKRLDKNYSNNDEEKDPELIEVEHEISNNETQR
ncbi:hypothetical protein WICMUC_004677 [Wickerhamomyces mucosus]|uniref:Major facilitator superfamily (MFS) profile domain-containing protein n=1 Tax=Wickerhamomyces mucosus TaxID=1378264 RepID=A0A9P8PH06_9ASCO|nr:hypothetical protein WICMUC_004677 [Wickerhamomyces mucosus]